MQLGSGLVDILREQRKHQINEILAPVNLKLDHFGQLVAIAACGINAPLPEPVRDALQTTLLAGVEQLGGNHLLLHKTITQFNNELV